MPKARSGREELLEAESSSYHSPGTCTFYGTANSNQMLLEFMGLHLPGTSFVNPGTPLREALTREAAAQALRITDQGEDYRPIGRILDVHALVNGIVGLLCDRRFHQPHDSPGGDRPRGGGAHGLGRLC
jgi:phosphogluconate dehydratase